MTYKVLKFAALALLPAARFTLTSCATTSGTDEVDAIETPQGAIIVDTFTMAATVTGIDAAKRDVTLVAPYGHKAIYKAGAEVVNFNQNHVGDQVKAKVTEEVAVFLGKGTPPGGMVGTSVALSPVGAKPGGVFVDTMLVTARVIAIDAKKHKVTLLLPDDTIKKVKVGKQVNLAAVQLGDNVTVQVSERLALSVQKP